MGHLIEDDVLKKSDFNDERFLYIMARRPEKHSLNTFTDSIDELTLTNEHGNHSFITIRNMELNDPITVKISCPGAKAEVTICKSDIALPVEIDISKCFTNG